MLTEKSCVERSRTFQINYKQVGTEEISLRGGMSHINTHAERFMRRVSRPRQVQRGGAKNRRVTPTQIEEPIPDPKTRKKRSEIWLDTPF